MKRFLLALYLTIGLALVPSCGAINGTQPLPEQEDAAVEAKAVAAAKKAAEELMKNLDKLASQTVIEPVDKSQPAICTNARITVRYVDSSVMTTAQKALDFTGYKSAPGFWSFMSDLVSAAKSVTPYMAPYFIVDRLAAAMTGSNTTYQNSFNGNKQSPVTIGNQGATTVAQDINQSTNAGRDLNIGNGQQGDNRDNPVYPAPEEPPALAEQ